MTNIVEYFPVSVQSGFLGCIGYKVGRQLSGGRVALALLHQRLTSICSSTPTVCIGFLVREKVSYLNYCPIAHSMMK